MQENTNPPGVVIEAERKKLKDMLLDGKLDAAMLGNDTPDDPRLRTLIPGPKAAQGRDAQNKAVSMNHLVVARKNLTQSRHYGPEALRPGLELAIQYSHRQVLLSRRLEVEELFDNEAIGLQ